MFEAELIKPLLTISFFAITLIFVGFSLSIIYHWFAYGIHKARSMIMLVTYLGISSLFFISMSLTLATF